MFKTVGLEHVLNPFHKGDLMEEITLEQLVLEVAGVQEEEREGLVQKKAEGKILTVAEKFECRTRANSIFEKRGGFCEAGQKTFSSSQRALRVANAAPLKLTSI